MRIFRSPRGSVLLEAALIAPVCGLLLAGILEVGRLFFEYNLVSYAVSEGARLAAVTPALLQDDERILTGMRKLLTSGGLRERSITVSFEEPLETFRPVSVRAEVDFLPLIAAAWPSGEVSIPLQGEVTARYEL